MAKKKSKTFIKVSKLTDPILNGKMLAIDPSTGSASSMPGYALYENAELVESGIFEIDPRRRNYRFYDIARILREEFPPVDLLAVEYIPAIRYKGGVSQTTVMKLGKAVGAILSAKEWPNIIEVPTASWKWHKPDNYEKTDEWDAITIGLCCINLAREAIEEE